MSRLWIKNPLTSFDGVRAGTADGGVVVQDGWIVETLGFGDTPNVAVDEPFDASGLILMPGLINTHHHFTRP